MLLVKWCGLFGGGGEADHGWPKRKSEPDNIDDVLVQAGLNKLVLRITLTFQLLYLYNNYVRYLDFKVNTGVLAFFTLSIYGW